MIDQQTLERLRRMRLSGMAKYLQVQGLQNELSFEEQLGLLVDYEWTYRQNRRLKRLLKEARFKLDACVEDIDYQHPRSLDKSAANNLKKGQCLLEHKNMLLTGPTGHVT